MESVLTSHVTSKGQVTIPAKVRREMGINPGSLVGFSPGDDGCYLIKPMEQDPLDELKGFLRYSGKPVTLEEMDVTIAEEVLKRQSS